MGVYMKQYIEKFENDVNDIRNEIEKAKDTLNSTDWTNSESLRELYEKAISVQEKRLQLAIEHHKMILESNGMGK